MKVPFQQPVFSTPRYCDFSLLPGLSADPWPHSSPQIVLNLSQAPAPLLITPGKGTSSRSGNTSDPGFFPTWLLLPPDSLLGVDPWPPDCPKPPKCLLSLESALTLFWPGGLSPTQLFE